MQSWHKGEGWTAKENGAAGRVWRPRATAIEAVGKCIAFTGGIGIPAMQVVELSSGRVVWRDSREDPDAGEQIDLPEEQQRLAQAVARKLLRTREPEPLAELPDQIGLW